MHIVREVSHGVEEFVQRRMERSLVCLFQHKDARVGWLDAPVC